MVAKGRDSGWGKCVNVVKGYKLTIIRWESSREVNYTMVAIVDKMVFYI